MPWEKVNIEQWAEELGVNINELRQKELLIEKIVKSRKRFGLTQGQLAEMVGVSQPRIAQIENRTKIGKISFDVLFNILGVLGHDFKITTRKVRDLENVNA